MTEDRKKRAFVCALWVLLILNMATIFALSARTAAESTVTSDAIVNAGPMAAYETLHLEKEVDETLFRKMQVAVRKTAHFMEFATLCLWAAGLLLCYRARHPYWIAGAFTVLYAASDEIHQIFVPGRDCKVTDWLIDAAGAMFGLLLAYMFMKRHEKKENRAAASEEKENELFDRPEI